MRDFLVHFSFGDIKKVILLSHATDVDGKNCKNIIQTEIFTSHCTQNTFNLRFSTDCTSQNVIYLIGCKQCNMQYGGLLVKLTKKFLNA